MQRALISTFALSVPGTIGEGSQVAMCSFVNKDVPPHELWEASGKEILYKLRESVTLILSLFFFYFIRS